MNIYKQMNEEQIALIKETGEYVKDKDYSDEEIKHLQNSVTEYIFSKSKKDIGNEVNRYSEILNIIGK